MINSRDINLLRQDVAVNCALWIERCRAAGLPVLVTNTVRDDEYQAYLYEQGRTRPGSIVTNSRTPTFHNVKAGLAFDFCKNIKGQEYSDTEFFRDAAALAKEMGFTWGGDWKTFVDMPHIQWDAGKTYTDADIKAGRYPPEMPLWGGEEDNVITYKTLADVPASYQPTVRKLMEAGALVGTSDPDPERLEDNVLNIDETYCRVMTTLDRLGILEVANGV